VWSYDALIRNAPILIPVLLAVVWELARPRTSAAARRLERWPANLAIGCLNGLLSRLPIVPIAAVAIGTAPQAGLLGRLGVPLAASIVVSVLLLDALAYARHRILHAVPALWRFHRVHHADVHLDFTTAFRFHPVEAILTNATAWAAVVLVGVAPLAVIAYEVFASVFTVLTHVNGRLPGRVDAALRSVAVTPAVHRLHHTEGVADANSNFGTVLSVWDRILATYRAPTAERETLPIGLAEFRDPKWRGLLETLRLPFARLTTT
jgi:sterol desaturase/sphingolipid hydroxylase (fatty acid hydroxylase superfamily)